jgi:hypothetical protein
MLEPVDRVDYSLVLDEVPWVHQTPAFRALEFSFAVRSADRAVGHHLEGLFTPFVVAGEPEHLYSIVPEAYAPGRAPRLYLDGEEIFVAQQLPWVFSHLLWHINRQVIDRSSSSYLLIHASAAEHAGRALLFPAPPESGKTTLVAGLIQAGLRYLTDEAVALDPGTGLVRPFPKALSIDPGSWAALANLRPHVDERAEPFNATQWHLRPDDIRPGAVAPPSRPALLVSPRYVAGADTEIVSISAADAVVLLVENSFNFAAHGRAGLYLLADLVRRSACFRLTVGSLDEACRLILQLVDRLTEGSVAKTETSATRD